MSTTLWEVLGGAQQGGILVRQSEEMTSKQFGKRLGTGSLVEELKLVGNRLLYKMISGVGPYKGWVSIRLKDKELLSRKLGPASGDILPDHTPSPPKPMPSGIRVCALSVAGNSLEMNVEEDFTVRDLRNVLSKRWSQEPECLKIIVGVQPLTDSEKLAAHYDAHDAALSVTVVVSLDELYSALEEPRLPRVQVKALQKLPALVPHACDRTITVISRCLESKAPSVRRQAVSSLLEVAGKGNPRATTEVEARLLHESVDVRVNALLHWPLFLAEDNARDTRILSNASKLSEDPSPEVRRIAFDMLREVLKTKRAERGDPFLVALAQEHLKKNRNVNNEFWTGMLWARAELAKELLQSGEAILCDSRDEVSFELSHIPGAWSLPSEQRDNYETLLQAIVARPQCPVIVYSDTGSEVSRCALVTQRMRRSPLIESHRVFRLIGGLNFWKHCNLPVQGDPRPMYGGQFWDKSQMDSRMAWVPQSL